MLLLINQSSLGQFMHEGIDRNAETVAGITQGSAEKGGSRYIVSLADEPREPLGNPFPLGQASDTRGQAVGAPFSLGHREQTELKEAVARLCREKIRIAAAGIQHHAIGMAGRE